MGRRGSPANEKPRGAIPRTAQYRRRPQTAAQEEAERKKKHVYRLQAKKGWLTFAELMEVLGLDLEAFRYSLFQAVRGLLVSYVAEQPLYKVRSKNRSRVAQELEERRRAETAARILRDL